MCPRSFGICDGACRENGSFVFFYLMEYLLMHLVRHIFALFTPSVKFQK